MDELIGNTVQISRNTEDGDYTGRVDRVNEEYDTMYVRVVESNCERVDGDTERLYAVGMSEEWSVIEEE